MAASSSTLDFGVNSVEACYRGHAVVKVRLRVEVRVSAKVRVRG